MNSPDALLVYQLLKDYHAITPDLKALRAHQWTEPVEDWQYDAEQRRGKVAKEAARSRATGWFNHVASLYLNGLIDARTLKLVASPRAAQLWVQHVAELDKEVRRSAGGDKAADMTPLVEQFWRDYAEGRVATLQFVFGPQGT